MIGLMCAFGSALIARMTTNTKANNPQPKRHHYLAESYLKGFAFIDRGKHFVVVHHRGRGFIDAQQPSNIGLITKQNVLLDPDGTENFSLEQAFADIESGHASAMVNLNARKDPTADERTAISKFVATTLTRTPEGIDAIQSAAEKISGATGIAAFGSVNHVCHLLRLLTHGSVNDEEAYSFALIVSKQSQDPKPNKNRPLKPAVLVAYVCGIHFAEQLNNRCFLLQRGAEAGLPFITTDAPVIVSQGTAPLVAGRGVDPWNDLSLIMMPLSATLLLAIHCRGSSTTWKDVSEDTVSQSNLIIARNRWRYIFGNDEAVIRSLVESPEVADRPHGARMALV